MKKENIKLSDFLSQKAKDLLSASGNKLVEQVGLDVIRSVVFDVLTGKNLRDSTEVLTRRRIAALNLSLFEFFIKSSNEIKDFENQLPSLAAKSLLSKKLSKPERWLSQWILGLTDKAFQNVLRDDETAIEEYKNNYIKTCSEIVKDFEKNSGALSAQIEVANVKSKLNWLSLLYLLNTIGSETLTIRGSEKSSHGKLFEKLILGSLLHILGFKFIQPGSTKELKKVFWLSERADKRESDATVLYEAGKGVRFDIGFIGRGNPEISLDKVTRFEKEIEFGRSKWFLATIIIVDRIGEKSRIEELAKKINGTIIQMSMGYWPQLIAKELKHSLGYNHKLANMEQSEIGNYLKEEIKKVPLEEFINFVIDDIEEE